MLTRYIYPGSPADTFSFADSRAMRNSPESTDVYTGLFKSDIFCVAPNSLALKINLPILNVDISIVYERHFFKRYLKLEPKVGASLPYSCLEPAGRIMTILPSFAQWSDVSFHRGTILKYHHFSRVGNPKMWLKMWFYPSFLKSHWCPQSDSIARKFGLASAAQQ